MDNSKKDKGPRGAAALASDIMLGDFTQRLPPATVPQVVFPRQSVPIIRQSSGKLSKLFDLQSFHYFHFLIFLLLNFLYL